MNNSVKSVTCYRIAKEEMDSSEVVNLADSSGSDCCIVTIVKPMVVDDGDSGGFSQNGDECPFLAICEFCGEPICMCIELAMSNK